MPQRQPAAPLQGDLEKDVREELDRILNSATFREAGRLKRFVEFIVTEAVSGRTDDLKEYVVGVQVFDKKSCFDPRTDPIVRVQARRLRAMLERYYTDEGSQDELVIDLPKGGYSPAFKKRHEAKKRSPAMALVTRNTVAITAFSDYSPAGDLGYFCKGLRQEVICAISKLPHIRILASVDSVEDADGRRLSDSVAALVISGSVRKSGDALRIAVQIVDGGTGCYLWSDTMDGSLERTFELQSAVAERLVQQLHAEFTSSMSGRSPRRPAVNLAARNLYIQGRYHLNQRTEDGMRKAVDFFERALVEDAYYGLAHSGLADAYVLLGHYGVLAPADVWTKAASSAASAVMLDDSSAEAHTSLAHVKTTQDWDWAGGEFEFQQAMRLDSTYATAHHWYAMSCLAPLGRLDQALDEMTVAHSLDPVSSIISRDVAVIHFYRREFDAALEQCDHTIELNPHFSAAFWTLGLIQEQRGDYEEAAAAFQRAIHLAPGSPRMQGALGRLFAVAGQRKLSLEVIDKLDEMAETRYVSPFEFASIRFALGEIDDGFEWLMRACRDRAFELLTVNVDPRFDSYRKDPRFTAIAAQIGFGSSAAAAKQRK